MLELLNVSSSDAGCGCGTANEQTSINLKWNVLYIMYSTHLVWYDAMSPQFKLRFYLLYSLHRFASY